ncbi:hypothetical protein BCR34DRAFT_564343 [Clohesyomyces aquaticus]|uniref:DNA 3'-5' helicase n=1 Tax=Clohesyomyces aquaticus TaxID=1231657 RepID=A0A1Y1ZP50_9PLEO|nr:hypothetical protein BCR34DRAFT_564343 [Clohesyomyces aquaticus]
MPTRNNLSEHLKWLLAEKPFVPSDTSVVAYDPNAVPSSASLSHDGSFRSDSSLNNAPESETIIPIVQPVPPPARAESRPDNTDRRLSATGTANMARLRATPGAGKLKLVLAGDTASRTPRLVIAGEPTRQALSGSSSRHSGNDRDDLDTRASQWKLEDLDTPAPRAAVPRRQRLETKNIHAIDLTADSQDAPGTGKKRKSDEFQEDHRPYKSPRSVKMATPSRESNFDTAEFADIDDLGPPPPYSTVNPLRTNEDAVQELEDSFSFDDLGFRPPDEDEPMVDKSPKKSPERRKRKSLSRAASEISAPPRKLGKKARSPSPTKPNANTAKSAAKRKLRMAISDSEDELDDLDEMDLEPNSDTKVPKSTRNDPTPSPDRPLSQASVKYAQISSLPIRSPDKTCKFLSPRQTKTEPVPTPAEPHSPPKRRPSPKKMQSTPALSAATQAATPHSSSELSKDKRESIRKAVESFLAAEGSRLSQHITVANASWEKARAAFAIHVEEYGSPDPAETEKMQRSRSNKEAIEQLASLANDHQSLSTKRQEIKNKIEDDLNQGEFNPANGATSNKIFKSLEDVQIRIYFLLEPAGFHQTLGRSIKAECADGNSMVIIQSTQTTPKSEKSGALPCPSSSNVPQTQYVKQTQIKVRETWTPSHHIRFADDPSAKPIQPLNLKRDTQGKPSPDYQNKSKPHDDFPRIRETPRKHHSPPTRPQGSISSGFRGQKTFHVPEEFGDDFDEDENLFSHNMGSPPCPADHDENFFDDDDQDFFDIDDPEGLDNQGPSHFDWRGQKAQAQLHDLPRNVLRETSINQAPQRKLERSPRKSQSQSQHVGLNFPWSRDIKIAMIKKFGLKGFRPGQLDAINATLSAEHCFVLMPTGGGKSLCYQLPSVINSGKTRGVTIVISPLLSLMEDQVQACRLRFKVQAYLINGESTAEDRVEITEKLKGPEPERFIQLLYLTPEMLSKSQRMIASIQNLYERGKLARIVIDEAHCVSQWGHDFRPDYKALGEATRRFTGVPIIALTATATQLVRKDVMINLGIEGCRLISQSFNRPNLSYEVIEKRQGVINSISDLIKDKHKGQCGIVYCLARKTCEGVAEKLRSFGIKAHHYHAGMEPLHRSKIQKQWQEGRYDVIVATIAFGMGIDKADVRFVIHQSIPKSLEGYYQETGRAGRDGKRSKCYLYYGYADTNVLRKMIDDGDGSAEQKQRQREMLQHMVQYCENRSDCRRAQVLGYFSERFDPADCKETCDNCQSDSTFETKNVTNYAVAVLELVEEAQDSRVTLLQCMDAFRGAKGFKLKNKDLKQARFGSDLDRGDVERLFTQLLNEDALRQESVKNKANFVTNYVQLGRKSRDYLERGKQLNLQIRMTPRKSAAPKPVTKKKKKQPAPGRTEYPSTNISSPIQAPSKQCIQQYVYQEDNYFEEHRPHRRDRGNYNPDGFVVPDGEDDEDDFEPLPPKRSKALQKVRSLGTPITVDERMAGLNEFQRVIVDGFVREARTIAERILIKKNLRKKPFSDTIFREMALDLPTTEDELLKIPGINPEQVRLYGNRFIALAKNTRVIHGDDLAEEQRPLDPNHRLIVDLTVEGDEEEEEEPATDETDYSDSALGEFDEHDVELTSHHFDPEPRDPEVEAFNKRMEEKESKRTAASTSSRGVNTSKSSSRGSSKGRGEFSKSNYRRKSGGGGSKFSAGVSKKGGAKKTNGRRGPGGIGGSGRPSGGNSRGSGGGGGWGNIMAMPT